MADYSTMSDAEIKAAVAERVMGWRVHHPFAWTTRLTVNDFPGLFIGYEGEIGEQSLLRQDMYDAKGREWNPLEDANARDEVVKAVKGKPWYRNIRVGHHQGNPHGGKWYCGISTGSFGGEAVSKAATPGRAVCEAALMAVDAMEGES